MEGRGNVRSGAGMSPRSGAPDDPPWRSMDMRSGPIIPDPSNGLMALALFLLVLPFALGLGDIVLGTAHSGPLLALYAPYSILVVVAFLGGAVLDYERTSDPGDAAVTAVMVAFISASRIPFAALPGVQPCTVLIFIYGRVFGPKRGILVGAMVALVSNIFLGHGPWTLWQMGAWGMVGGVGGLLGQPPAVWTPGARWRNAILVFILGIAYGLTVNISTALFLDSYLLAVLSSLPFDIMHAVGNVLFFLALGEFFSRELGNIRERRTYTWECAGRG